MMRLVWSHWVLLFCIRSVHGDSRWTGDPVMSDGLCRYGNSVECCWGWKQTARGRCQPLCPEGCKHGQCVAPDRCKCRPGFTGKSCNQDVNECGLKPRPCKHRCMNTHGSYKCFCLDGYMMQPDGSCKNARTCGQANCQYGCEVIKGVVRCTCPLPRLRLGPDRRTCVDVNECVSGGGVCPRRRKCVNTFGSYMCKCHLGFKLTYINGRYNCIDKDTRPFCSLNPGSPKCRCKDGHCKGVPKVTVQPHTPRTTTTPPKKTTTPTSTTRTTRRSTTTARQPVITTTTAIPPTSTTTTLATTTMTTPTTTAPPTTTTPPTTTAPPTTTTTPPTTTAPPTTTTPPTTTAPSTTIITTTPSTTMPSTTTASTTTPATTTTTTTPTPTTTTIPTTTQTITEIPATTSLATTELETTPVPTTTAIITSTTASTTPVQTTAASTTQPTETTQPTTPTITTRQLTTTTAVAVTTTRPATTTSLATSAPPPPPTTTVNNRIHKDVTQRNRGDGHKPRPPGHNHVLEFEFEIEPGNTADDPAAGVLQCTFEQGMCDWLSDREGDMSWQTVHNPTGGRYLSVPELKAGQRSIRGARLAVSLAPAWNQSDVCFSFSHWLTGHHVGVLQLFTRKRGRGQRYGHALWSRTGSHGWRQTQVTMWGVEKVLLKAERKGRGQIAIDDITVKGGACR